MNQVSGHKIQAGAVSGMFTGTPAPVPVIGDVVSLQEGLSVFPVFFTKEKRTVEAIFSAGCG